MQRNVDTRCAPGLAGDLDDYRVLPVAVHAVIREICHYSQARLREDLDAFATHEDHSVKLAAPMPQVGLQDAKKLHSVELGTLPDVFNLLLVRTGRDSPWTLSSRITKGVNGQGR